MTTTTYGALLTGLGVFCGIVSFGLNHQAKLIAVIVFPFQVLETDWNKLSFNF
jgi:hypothetical protein